MKICNEERCNRPVKPDHIRQNGGVQIFSKCSQCTTNRARYRISTPERDDILAAQGGVCKICESKIAFTEMKGGNTGKHAANVDHLHGTKSYRGILCGNCNTALGLLDDDPSLMLKAIIYLEEHLDETRTESITGRN